MQSEKEKYETTILALDNEIDLLKKDNIQLKNKLILLEPYKEKSKTHDVKIIRKDKYINKLKESIKKDYLEFNKFEIIPESYLRISNRFPHLKLQDIMIFEKRIRENGGSIQVHSGKFEYIQRVGSIYKSIRSYVHYVSWTCCCSAVHTDHNEIVFQRPNSGTDSTVKQRKCSKTHEACGLQCIHAIPKPTHPYCPHGNHMPHSFNPICCEAVIRNPTPDGDCDNPETFYLREEDEKLQDIKKVSIEHVSLNITNNINTYEETIAKYLSKISKLKSLQQTLDLLTED